MTDEPTDKELYELANSARYAEQNFSIGELKRLNELCDAVIKRFKPREPRVIERWARISDVGYLEAYSSTKDEAKRRVEEYGGYLARVVATEVIEGE